MGNRLQLQLLAPDKWIPLRKLKAGHFSIPCLPTPLTRWPSVSSSEWIVIGKGSCCEVQVGSKQKWLLKKLKKASAEASVPESQVTEHFLPEAFLEQSSDAWLHHASRPTSMDRSWEPSAGEQSSFALVQDDHSAEDSSEVALAWNSSLAGSAAIPEVFTTSFAVSDHSERMAGAGECHGGEVCVAERLAQADRHREPVHHLPPQGVCSSSRSDGSAVGLYGGRCDHLRPGGIEAATSEEVARSSGSGDNEIAAAESRREDAATSRLTRAKRRIAEAQGRAGQSSRIAEREGRPRSHSRSDQEAAAAHREGLDREAELGSTRHPAIVIDSSSEAEAQAHSSSNTTDSESGFSRFARWFRRASRASSSSLEGPQTSRAATRATGLGCGAGGGQPHVRDVLLSSLDGRGRLGGDNKSPDAGSGACGAGTAPGGGCGAPERGRSAVSLGIGKMTKKAFATMKRGLKQTVHQGFLHLRRLHEALSIDFNEVHEILEASEYNLKMEIIEGIKEPFVVEVKMPPLPEYQNFAYRKAMETNFNAAGQLPLVGETFADSEQVKKQAELRGHSTMESVTLATGFDFFRPSRERRAFWQVEDDDPYCQVIAFPCGPWSPLHALRARDRHRAALLKWRRKKHVKLVNFAVALARKQMRRKKHFIMENGKPLSQLGMGVSSQFEEATGRTWFASGGDRPMPFWT